ncbi:hypothetical protein GH714_039027 [Hevea brasiliensis]|uniref:Uncharacterized protein n=1 Tax=Hevea brasiliensis TaxID=3981 RepID=A0A6A6K9X2_HEVBR|nr:hypothetical protein GH714_039027 [Hevea brasiliensis]
MRQGLAASARSAVFGGILLALIEGAGIMLNKVMSAQQSMPVMIDESVPAMAGGPGFPMGLPGQSQPQPQLVQETASTSGSESGSWFGGFWKLRLDAACGSSLGSNILRTWVFGNMEKRQAVEVRFPSETSTLGT